MAGLENVTLHLIESLDDVLAFREWLGNRRPTNALGLDTETSGLERDARVRLVQFGDHEHGWAIEREEWLGIVRDVVRRWEGDFILHNAPFDAVRLERSCGIKLPRERIHDTMPQARINEPNASMALKSQSTRHVDAAAASLQFDVATLGKSTLGGRLAPMLGWTWANVPTNYGPYWKYGALDPVLAYHLDLVHRPQVEAEAPRAYDLERAVMWVAVNMTDYGARVDRKYAAEKKREFDDYCEQVEVWCRDEYGIKPGSNAAVAAKLLDAGFNLTKRTEKGATALDAEVLEEIDHPLAQAVLRRRRLQKLSSTYLRFYSENADSDDLVHPNINTLGAVTSRMSMDSPNLQNLPVRGNNPEVKVVRNCIISRWVEFWGPLVDYRPTRHGALLMVDFSQIEARLLAHFAREQHMIDAFAGERDFFINLACRIYQVEDMARDDLRRQVTKNATYAILYGAGIRKFSQTAGITETAANEFMRTWNTLFPGVRAFQNAVQNTALQRRADEGVAYARSPLTGRRYVAQAGKEYALVNYVIQGVAAEVLKLKLVELDAAGLGRYMVAPVHDEVILDVPDADVADVVRTLELIMNDDSLFDVPVRAEVSYGRRWGEKQPWAWGEVLG